MPYWLNRRTILIAANTAALLLFLLFLGKFFLHFRMEAKNAVADGRRVIYRFSDSSLQIRMDTPQEKAAAVAIEEEAKAQAIVEKGPENGVNIPKPSAEYLGSVTVTKDPFVDPKSVPKAFLPDARLGVVVRGLGLHRDATLDAISLPKQVTLSFSAYAPKPKEWLLLARSQGHEVMLDLPVQTTDYPLTDPGPAAVMVSLKEKENLNRMHDLLAKATGIKGVILGDGEDITTRKSTILPLAKELNKRGLVMMYQDRLGNRFLRTDASLQLKLVAEYLQVDDDVSQAIIDRALQQTHALMSEKKGDRVVMFRANPLSLHRLRSWITMLQQRKATLLPVSALNVEVEVK